MNELYDLKLYSQQSSGRRRAERGRRFRHRVCGCGVRGEVDSECERDVGREYGERETPTRSTVGYRRQTNDERGRKQRRKSTPNNRGR